MLICSQCHSENPNRNHFCQKCGISLINRPCPECGATVLLSDPFCLECGTVTGKILTVLIQDSQLGEEITLEKLELYDGHIDVGQRYKLFQASETSAISSKAVQDPSTLMIKVVDCQPLQPSILKVLLSQASDLMTGLPTREVSDILDDPAWQNLGLPSLAIAYLQLESLGSKIPEVYDAWCEGSSEFILLGDRQALVPLEAALEEEALPVLQLIFWINQNLLLWQTLSRVHLGQSLTTAKNICIDEDQNLALVRLYPDLDPPVSQTEFVQQLKERFTAPPQELPAGLGEILDRLLDSNLDSLESGMLEIAKFVEHLDSETLQELSPDFETIGEDLAQLDVDAFNTAPDTNFDLSDDGDELPTAVLPMQLISLNDAGYTDRGTKRNHNEDYFGVDTQFEIQRNNHGKAIRARGVYVVCDGMGGHAAGEVASELAVKTLQTFFKTSWQDRFPTTTQISEAITLANQAIYEINQSNASSGSGRMGTTMVMVLLQDNKLAIAHVGDSRIYRVTRKGGLQQLTIDHEVGQQAIQNGLDPSIAYARPYAYQLTQALGPHDHNYIQPDIGLLDIEEDSLIFLCSDGISDNDFLEEHWEKILLPLISSSQDLDRGLRKLMEFANEYNGHDNLTGVLIRIKVRPQIPIDVW